MLADEGFDTRLLIKSADEAEAATGETKCVISIQKQFCSSTQFQKRRRHSRQYLSYVAGENNAGQLQSQELV